MNGRPISGTRSKRDSSAATPAKKSVRDHKLPDLETITQGLNSVLQHVATGGAVKVVAREPHIYASTFPSEIITCHLDDGRELQLYCKYSAGVENDSFQHRGGVAYEALVYRYVLSPIGVRAPTYYGDYQDPATGWTCLVLENLDNILWVSRTPSPETMLAKAADWVGRFHASGESRRSESGLGFLTVYDREYYNGWLVRSLEFARTSGERIPWLEALWQQFEGVLEILLNSRPTIIHGEFCPHNIIVHNQEIYPVDWESAAVGLGEIDLVALTEGWSDAVHQNCEDAYCRARWPNGPPSDVTRIIDAARIYWNLRWLGESRRSFERKSARIHLREIRDASERLATI